MKLVKGRLSCIGAFFTPFAGVVSDTSGQALGFSVAGLEQPRPIWAEPPFDLLPKCLAA